MTNLIGAVLMVLSVETNFPAEIDQPIRCAEAQCVNATNEACMYWHTKHVVLSNIVQTVTTVGANGVPLFRIIDQRSDELWHGWTRWEDAVRIEGVRPPTTTPQPAAAGEGE